MLTDTDERVHADLFQVSQALLLDHLLRMAWVLL